MRKSVWRFVAMPSLLVAAFAVFSATQSPAAHAAPVSKPYVSSLYVNHGQLSRSWSFDGYHWTHSTNRWHRSGSRLVSDQSNWVPNCNCVVRTPYTPTWVWESAQHALGQSGPVYGMGGGSYTGATSAPTRQTAAVVKAAPAVSESGLPLRTSIGQWNSTGYSAWRGNWGDVATYSYGWCTWGAAHFAHDNLSGLGNADQWLGSAQRRGLPTGYSPRVGATVTFAPGVQGAGGAGHVAHVVGVYGNGWFMVEETDFSYNGGGFGIVSYRYAHSGSGVAFIY